MESLETVLKGRGSPAEVLDRMEKGQDVLASHNLRLLDKLDRMSEGFAQTRNAIVTKLDEILKALYERR